MVSISDAFAQPVQWPAASGGNGHYYQWVLAPNIKWMDAKTAAEQSSFNGVQGTLATITSAAESAFLDVNLNQTAPGNGWLGAYQDTAAPDYSEPAGGWRWVTGEAWGYTNWHSNVPVQPDNSGGSQNFVRAGGTNFVWDDFQNDPANPSVQQVTGYYVEFVPEPGSASLLGTVAAAMLIRRRRWRYRFSRVRASDHLLKGRTC